MLDGVRPLLVFPTRSPCEVYQHSAGSFGVFGYSAEDVLKGQFTQTWNIFSLLGDEGVNEASSYHEHSSLRFDGTVHQLLKQERGSKNRLLRAGFIVQQKENGVTIVHQQANNHRVYCIYQSAEKENNYWAINHWTTALVFIFRMSCQLFQLLCLHSCPLTSGFQPASCLRYLHE